MFPRLGLSNDWRVRFSAQATGPDRRPVSSIFPSVFTITGPSGVGKNTILTKTYPLLAPDTFSVSVSATTRPPREGERHGVNYWFMSRPGFRLRRALGRVSKKCGFAEWNRYGDNFYGTPAGPIFKALRAGKSVFGDLDINGVQQLARVFPKPTLKPVLILPPGDTVTKQLAELEKRLKARGETLEGIRKRLGIAEKELGLFATAQASPQPLFALTIVNEDSAASALQLARYTGLLKQTEAL